MQKALFEWNPQLVVDHHGQPSQFFFPPVALPINPNLPQPVTNKWMDIFGRANAAAFDRNKWDYYNRDIFDLYYPGYWDSMQSLNGAIGMTYETDGGGFKGLRWTRDDGSIVGTIGGGCVEADVWQAAREVMESEKPRTLHFDLNQDPKYDTGLVCGGTLEVFVEPVLPPALLYLFGAGHVSVNLCRTAAPAAARNLK